MCYEVALSDVYAAYLDGMPREEQEPMLDAASVVDLTDEYSEGYGALTCPCGQPAEYAESYCHRCAQLFQRAYQGSHSATASLEALGHDL